MAEAGTRQPGALFEDGLRAYHEGQHYEAHEFWEELWHAEQDDDRRRFLQALIQITSAVHKAQNNVGPRGCPRLLRAAIDKLQGLPSPFMGLDLDSLRAALPRCIEAIDTQLAAGGSAQLTPQLIPPMTMVATTPIWLRHTPAPKVPDPEREAWFEKGLSLYAEAEFFEAHEAWEELWRDERDPTHKRYLQGLIQVAAAMHKLFSHRHPKPAARLLRRALDKLAGLARDHDGLDLLTLRKQAVAICEHLETGVGADEAIAATTPPVIARLPADPPAPE